MQGQPGGHLASGQSDDDAIDNLLDGLYAKTPGSPDNPVEKVNLVEKAPSTGGGETGNDAGARGDGRDQEDCGGGGGGEASQENIEGGAAEGETEGIKQKSEGDNGREDGACSSKIWTMMPLGIRKYRQIGYMSFFSYTA